MIQLMSAYHTIKKLYPGKWSATGLHLELIYKSTTPSTHLKVVQEDSLIHFILCFCPGAPPTITTTTSCGISVISTPTVDIYIADISNKQIKLAWTSILSFLIDQTNMRH